MSISIKEWCESVEKIVEYKFKKQSWLVEALTHPSYSFEQKVSIPDNQRLEFLGDAIIEIVVSEKLFIDFPDKDEGEMSKMRSATVNREKLGIMGKKLDLHLFIFIGQGDKKSNLQERDSTLCDAFEALIGAIYLDSGLDAAKKVFWETFEKCKFELILIEKKFNPKGVLQELTQEKYSCLPSYTIKSASGPEHLRSYIVEVSFSSANQEFSAKGKGQSVKNAEIDAAANLLEKFKEND